MMSTSARGVSGWLLAVQRAGGGAHGGAPQDGVLFSGEGGEGKHLFAQRLPRVACGLFRALGLAVAAGVVEEDAVVGGEQVEGGGALGVLLEGGEDAVSDDGEGRFFRAGEAVAQFAAG